MSDSPTPVSVGITQGSVSKCRPPGFTPQVCVDLKTFLLPCPAIRMQLSLALPLDPPSHLDRLTLSKCLPSLGPQVTPRVHSRTHSFISTATVFLRVPSPEGQTCRSGRAGGDRVIP